MLDTALGMASNTDRIGNVTSSRTSVPCPQTTCSYGLSKPGPQKVSLFGHVADHVLNAADVVAFLHALPKVMLGRLFGEIGRLRLGEQGEERPRGKPGVQLPVFSSGRLPKVGE